MFPKRGMVQLSGPELAQDDSHHPSLSGFALTLEILELSPSVGDCLHLSRLKTGQAMP